jgi:hypothetical protein
MLEQRIAVSYDVRQDERIMTRRRLGDKVIIDGRTHVVSELRLALKVQKDGPLVCLYCEGRVQLVDGDDGGFGACPHCSEKWPSLKY